MVQIVFSDIAGTIVTGNPWDYIRKHEKYNHKQGQRELRRFLPVYFGRKLRLISDTSFRHNWLIRVGAAFKGMSRDTIREIYQDTVANQMSPNYREDVIDRLKQHQQNGAKVILVSGMFRDLVEAFADYVGADGAIGTHLYYDANGITDGTIDGETCVGYRKPQFVERYLNEHYPDVSITDCYGYADSYSDRSLLDAVGHGVATYPDDQLRQVALTKGWDMIPA